MKTANQTDGKKEAKSTKNEPVIEVNNLRIGFDGEDIIKDLTLQLFKGENLVVLGRSGAGKSVLIKCMVRLLNYQGGTISVLGNDVSTLDNIGLAEMRKKIGFLFQGGALYDSMTVKQNLEFPLKRIINGLTRKQIDEKIDEALVNVGLADAIDKMPAQLSGGMRKRISLARTIVVGPSIMLYDEPTTGLDPATSDEISLLINEVQKKYKTSSIIITHDIECARQTANRAIMMHNGEVYLEGKLDSFETSTDPILKSFFK